MKQLALIALSIAGGLGCIAAVVVASVLFILFLKIFPAIVGLAVPILLMTGIFSALIYTGLTSKKPKN